MDRQQWLAVRDSGSLGQCLRSRGRLIHLSKPLVVVDGDDGSGPRVVVSPLPGITLKLGRNERKRAHRAGKSRKQWRRVA
jgi:hypothetical protein